jgi:hypothetical protein
LRINVISESSAREDFHLFQQPSRFSGGHQVYSCSLGCYGLINYESSGAVLTFQIDPRLYAAVHQAPAWPTIGQFSGYPIVARRVDLAGGGVAMAASVDPQGLTPPQAVSDAPAGAFRIMTGTFEQYLILHLGSAVEANGLLGLSSFVCAPPDHSIDCAPVARFYVRKGFWPARQIIDFERSTADAAVCDFTVGGTEATVTYRPDGSWTVEMC